MSFELVYTHRAERDIKKLNPSVKKRIGKALLKLKDNPMNYSEKLKDTKIGDYRYRIGDYRVIFDIHENDIVILRVGHRRDIYKSL